MNELTTDVKTHAVITYTKVHYLITAEQEKRLQTMPTKRPDGVPNEIDIENGNTLKLNNIADILTLEKYYETYPDKQSANYGQPYAKINELPAKSMDSIMAADYPQYTKEDRNKAQSALFRGLQKFIDRNKALGIATPKAQALLNKARAGKTERVIHKFDPDKETWKEFNERIAHEKTQVH